MTEVGMFRSALSGFHKQDVLDYIDQITADWNAERLSLMQEADRWREEAAQVEDAVRQANEEAERAREMSAKAAAEIERAQNAVQQATQQANLQVAAQMEEYQRAAETARQEAAAAKAQMASVGEQLYHATGELDTKNVAIKSMEEVLQQKEAELTALREQLAHLSAHNQQVAANEAGLKEKQAELEATARRLQQTEEKLAEQSVRLTALQQQVTNYEAVLGNAQTAQEHVDSIVRPFIDQANRQADETLDSVQAVLAGVLAQLGELQGNVDQRRQALRRCKADSDTRLSAAFGDWIAQARHSTPSRSTSSFDTSFYDDIPLTGKHFFR